MFIKKITISNYKCYGVEPKTITFKYPNGEFGSGLNIFVGKNNSGKSTIIEAIKFFRDGITGKGVDDLKNKFSKDADLSVEVCFCGNINETIENFAQDNKKEILKKYVYIEENCEYLKAIKTSANGKEKEIQLWNNETNEFKNETGIAGTIQKLFEMEYIWSDTNPNDETKFGATTICGKLLKEISKSLSDEPDYKDFLNSFEQLFNGEKSSLRSLLSSIEKKTQNVFKNQFGDAEIKFKFQEPNTDLYFKSTKVGTQDGSNFFSLEENGSGMQRAVALALLQVYSETLKSVDGAKVDKPFYLFVDEPEICLHPSAQKKLFNALAEISKYQQVFITTHSPYFISPELVQNVWKLENDGKNISTSSMGDDIVFNVKKMLDLENREIFFVNKVILVEGVKDRYCLRRFVKSDNYELFVISGLNNLETAKGICEKLKIDFMAVVDLDFLFKRYPELRISLPQEDIDNIEEVVELNKFLSQTKMDEKLKKSLEKFRNDIYSDGKKCQCSKILSKISSDDVYKALLFTKIEELKKEKIFVLPNGSIEHYLDKDGTPLSEDKKQVLLQILGLGANTVPEV